MQEEMTNQAFEIGGKAVSLVFKGADLTLDILHDLIKSLLENKETSLPSDLDKQSFKKGKQSVKDLIGQKQGVENIEINSNNIGLFTSSARKFGVDFAMTKDKSTDPPTHTVFFKGKDASAITSTFKDFVQREEKKVERGEIKSLNKELQRLKKELGKEGKNLTKEQLKDIHNKRKTQENSL